MVVGKPFRDPVTSFYLVTFESISVLSRRNVTRLGSSLPRLLAPAEEKSGHLRNPGKELMS